MRTALTWGRQELEIEIADRDAISAHRAAPAPDLADPSEAARAALEHPHDYPALRLALTPDDHVAILVDESLLGVGRFLVPILEHVRAAGVTPEAITLVCLPPSSGQPWLEELPDEFQDVTVEVHQPGDRRKLSYLAATKHGHRIYLNRTAVDADQFVVLTRRRYDPVVGYAGGELAIYPGLSDEETRAAARTKLHVQPPGRGRWPLSQEATEVAWLLGAPFLVQVIEGSGDQIAQVLGGPVGSSVEGQRLLDARWRVEIDSEADVVVAGVSGDPARHTAEDLARAFFAAARVVRPGGSIVVLSDASPAFGPSFDLLRQNEEASVGLQRLHEEKPADLSAGFMWATAAVQAKLYLLSRLPTELAEELFVVPLKNAPEVQRLVTRGACLILPDAHKTLAVVRS